MKTATLEQFEKLMAVVLGKIHGMPSEQMQSLIESGALSDVFEANFNSFDREAHRKVLGLKPLNPPAPPLLIALGTSTVFSTVTPFVARKHFDGWNVNANDVTNPNTWNDGNQVFSRNSCILPSSDGSFCFKAFPPSAEHLSDVVQLFRELKVSFVIKGFHVPHGVKKEFCKIKPRCRFLEIGYFLLRAEVACDEN